MLTTRIFLSIRVESVFNVRQINYPTVSKIPYIHTNQQIRVVVKNNLTKFNTQKVIPFYKLRILQNRIVYQAINRYISGRIDRVSPGA